MHFEGRRVASNLRNHPITERGVLTIPTLSPDSSAAIALAGLQTGEDRFVQRATLCRVPATGQRAKMSGAEMGKSTTRLLWNTSASSPAAPSHVRNLSSRECRVAVIHRTADARSHELRMEIKVPAHRFFALVIKIFQACSSSRARQVSPLSANSCQRRQTFGSYRYGKNVSLASAQEIPEDHQQPPT